MNQFTPSLITVNLMLIRDTLNQKMVAYNGNDEYIDQVKNLFASTRSLIQSVNVQVSMKSRSNDEEADWMTMCKASMILLNSWELELDDFEKEWHTHLMRTKEQYLTGR